MSCEAIIAVLLKIRIWRNVTPCRLVKSYCVFSAIWRNMGLC